MGVSAEKDELLRAIYDSPRDDASRLVYADWLQERGEPRGEMIALSFAASKRALTKTEKSRMKTLLNHHEQEWLGPAVFSATLKGSRIYKRGFLYRCGLTASMSAATRAAALVDPRWATVEEIDARMSRPFAMQLLGQPQVARWLRVIDGITPKNLGTLAKNHLPLANLEKIGLVTGGSMTSLYDDSSETGSVKRADLASGAVGLPSLVELDVEDVFAHTYPLSATEVGRRLRLVRGPMRGTETVASMLSMLNAMKIDLGQARVVLTQRFWEDNRVEEVATLARQSDGGEWIVLESS